MAPKTYIVLTSKLQNVFKVQPLRGKAGFFISWSLLDGYYTLEYRVWNKTIGKIFVNPQDLHETGFNAFSFLSFREGEDILIQETLGERVLLLSFAADGTISVKDSGVHLSAFSPIPQFHFIPDFPRFNSLYYNDVIPSFYTEKSYFKPDQERALGLFEEKGRIECGFYPDGGNLGFGFKVLDPDTLLFIDASREMTFEVHRDHSWRFCRGRDILLFDGHETFKRQKTD